MGVAGLAAASADPLAHRQPGALLFGGFADVGGGHVADGGAPAVDVYDDAGEWLAGAVVEERDPARGFRAARAGCCGGGVAWQ